LSGVEALLRVTEALPVKVATFPIGSSAPGCASAGAEAGALCGAGVGWGWAACASLIRPLATTDARSASTGDGIANACGAPDVTRHISHVANKT
jgi:hypothetical protein